MGNSSSNSAVKQRIERAGNTKLLSLEDSGLSGGDIDNVLKKLATANLRALDVSGNKLQKLPKNCPKNGSLKKLNISRNKISDIDAIAVLTELEELTATNNLLEVVGTTCLAQMARLKKIDLSRNVLHTISITPSLVLLAECNISHNKLTVLPPALFGLPKLTKLDASHNELKALPDMTHGIGAPPELLQVLDVSHNRITTLPAFLFSSTKLINFQMDGNPVTRAELEALVGEDVYSSFMQRQKKTVDKQISAGLTAQMIKET